MKQHIKPRKS